MLFKKKFKKDFLEFRGVINYYTCIFFCMEDINIKAFVKIYNIYHDKNEEKRGDISYYIKNDFNRKFEVTEVEGQLIDEFILNEHPKKMSDLEVAKSMLEGFSW